MEKKIIELIKRHYKTAKIEGINLEDGVVYLSGLFRHEAFVAKRILETYPEIRRVEFVGYITNVFSRETLKWLGYFNN
jgi:hypothetical protein